MAVLIGAVTLIVGVTPAAAQGSRAHREALLRVLSPQNHQGVFSDGVPVVLRVRRGATVRVKINQRDVTRSLRLRGKRTLRGRLPQRLLRRVPRLVTISAKAGRRTDADVLILRAVRRQRGFLRVSARRTGPGPAPIDVRLRTRTHRLWLAIQLNGRRIERSAVATKVRERHLLLTRTEGLRYGRNVLRIAANDSHGRGDLERRVFHVPRTGPLIGARWVRRVGRRSTVRMDARPSTASRRGHRLVFTWQLVRRPRGSRAVLRNKHGRVARVRPDRPGRYVARLRVRERRRRTHAGGAARASAETTPTMDVAMDAAPYVPPYGIEATLDPVNGMVLNPGTNIPVGSAAGSMAVARINGSTTSVDEDIDIDPAAGTRDLPTLLSQVTSVSLPGDLIVVVGNQSPPEPSGSATNAAVTNLSSMLQGLGLSSADATDAAQRMAQGAPFAFIGTVQGVEGSGVGNFFDGQLHGYLRFTGLGPNLTGQLVFEQPDYRLFDFNGADQRTTVSGINPGQAGAPTVPIDTAATTANMAVTVLDAVTLEPVTSAVNSSGGQNGAAAPVAQVLSQYTGYPNGPGDSSKLILFKMIQPTAWENTRQDMATIMRSLTKIGANKDAFTRSLNYGAGSTNNQYVFLGGVGIQGVEGSGFDAVTSTNTGGNPIPVSSSSLNGVLQRDQKGRWVPTAGSTTDQLDRDLQAIAVAPPTQYQYPTDQVPGTQAQYAAAELALFDKLDDANPSPFCKVSSSSCNLLAGVRVNYANSQLLDNLTLATTILGCGSQQSARAAGGGGAYTPQQLSALTTQVCTELGNLETIHDEFFDEMTSDVLPDVANQTQATLLTDSDDLFGFLTDEQDLQLQNRSEFLGISGEAAGILEELVSSAVSVASLATAPEGGLAIGSLAGSLLGVSSDTLGLAGQAVGTGEDPDKVAAAEVTAGTLFGYMPTTFTYASDRLKDIEAIVNSDPAKVAAVLAKVNAGDWDLQQNLPNSNTDTAAELVTFHQQAAAQQYMWPRLISAVATPCDTGGSSSDPTTYQAFTKLEEYQPPANFLRFEQYFLRGAHLDSSDAQQLAPFIFGAPFQPGYDISNPPKGAGLPRSPFYMVQVASTSTSNAPDCSEDTF